MMDDESETCLAKLNKLLSFYESALENMLYDEPEIWWKIKKKLKTKLSLKPCHKMYF